MGFLWRFWKLLWEFFTFDLTIDTYTIIKKKQHKHHCKMPIGIIKIGMLKYSFLNTLYFIHLDNLFKPVCIIVKNKSYFQKTCSNLILIYCVHESSLFSQYANEQSVILIKWVFCTVFILSERYKRWRL